MAFVNKVTWKKVKILSDKEVGLLNDNKTSQELVKRHVRCDNNMKRYVTTHAGGPPWNKVINR